MPSSVTKGRDQRCGQVWGLSWHLWDCSTLQQRSLGLPACCTREQESALQPGRMNPTELLCEVFPLVKTGGIKGRDIAQTNACQLDWQGLAVALPKQGEELPLGWACAQVCSVKVEFSCHKGEC